MSSHPPKNVILRVLEYLRPQDIAFRTCLLNLTWNKPSLIHLYRTIPPFSSAYQLSRACKTIIAHPEDVARWVFEFSIMHSMLDIDKIPTLYYTVRAALALCTGVEILHLHVDPSVMRIMLGECTFQLKTLSVIDCHRDLPTVFLSRQENLEELTILRGDTTPLYLPKDTLPKLSSFSGIPENAIRISRGRRLKILRILPGSTPLKFSNLLFKLDSLVMSSLNEFHVLVTGSVLHHVTILSQFLPHLTTVVVRYYQQNIPFGMFTSTISAFVNLREYSMISLNTQQPLTPVTLDSEYSIVTQYHRQCPTLRVIVLRCVCWVRDSESDNQWSPHAGDLDVLDMWHEGCEKRQIDTKEAESNLRGYGGVEQSGDDVSMDMDETSDGDSEVIYGPEEPMARQVLVYTDEIEEVRSLVKIDKSGGESQEPAPRIDEGSVQ